MKNSVYDDQDIDSLEKSFHGPSATESGSDKLALKNLEDAYGGADASESGSEKLGKGYTGKDLKDKEEQEPDRSRFSAADHINEKLGKGYTGKGSQQNKFFSKLNSSNSAFKKKIAIAGAAAGGSAVLGVLAFMAMLPLKIETIVNGLEAKYSVTASRAVGTEGENMLNKYMATRVLPAIKAGKCHTTIDATCVALDGSEKGPIGQVFRAWKDQGIERKLAQKYGIVMGARGSNQQLYMAINGRDIAGNADLEAIMKDPAAHSIFDLGSDDRRAMSKTEVREALRNAFKDASFWDKTYYRLKVNRLMERKYGLKHCWLFCTLRDGVTGKLADRKLAAKAWTMNFITKPLAGNYGLIMQCVMGGTDVCSKDSLDKAARGDISETTPAQRAIQERLLTYIQGDTTSATLEALVKSANEISSDGLSKYIARQAVSSIMSQLGGDAVGDAAGQAAEKAVPVIGWVLLLGQIGYMATTIGPAIQHIGYAANAAASVQMYSGYQTVASEMKSGHMDAAVLGSFNQALTTNTDPTSSDKVDATQTPYYQSVFGSSAATSGITAMLDNILPGKAYADSSTTSTSTNNYKCEDGKTVPSGKLVCDSEKFDRGNPAFSSISDFTNSIPGFKDVAGILNKVNNVIGSAFNTACDIFYPCKWGMEQIGNMTSGIFAWITNKLIQTPFGMSNGGRNFDMIGAGAAVSNYDSCQTNLGCAEVSPETVAMQENEQIAEDKANFNSMSMFARMFDTNSQYSLVSRMALTMPTNLVTASNSGLGSLLSDPVDKLSTALSSVFTGNRAFAASTPTKNPFGAPEVGYTKVPADPETFWDNNCVNGPLAKYDDSTKQLDISDWLNDPANASQDPSTGTLVYHKTNACQLIQSTAESVGFMFDPTIAGDDANSDPGTSDASTGTTTASLNTSAAEAAAKSASTGNVKVGYALYDDSGSVSKYNPTELNYGASITKSMLLVAYLKQVGSSNLSTTAETNLTAMIENSDNDASNWIYHQLTNPTAAINKVASDAGMNSFKLDTSDPAYVLGQSTISADDFAKFFSKIDTLLAGPQQSFGLKLLSHLSAADQNGLLQAGLPGTVYSKEGWKPEPAGTRGTPYIVNQAAQFSSGGKTYGVAVTVSGVKDQASGEAIVKAVVSALLSAGTPT
jgi:hypothetical protein